MTTPRRQIETELELRQPNTSLMTWLAARRSENKSLREIARDLTTLTGVQVSHESVRKWLRDG